MGSIAMLSNVLPVITSLLVIVASYLAYRIFLYSKYFSPLRYIPGPPSDHVVYGNMPGIIQNQPQVLQTAWSEKYGGVVKYTGILGEDRLCFTDPVALNYILGHAYDFPKPNELRGELSRILGKGVLFAEGDDHKRQRKIMNPAFSPSHLRDIAPTFFSCSYRLRDKWITLIEENMADPSCFKDVATSAAYQTSKPDDEIVLEVSRWLSRVTLDVIGEAGFGYEFGALEGKTSKLADAFSDLFNSNGKKPKPAPWKLLAGRGIQKIINKAPFDVSKYIPLDAVRRARAGLQAMEEASADIVQAKKAQVVEEGTDSMSGSKDLMTLLLRSNMSGDPKTMLTDTELQGQMTTMLLAGHETSSTTLTWLLWRISSLPEVQNRLRAEVRQGRRKAIDAGKEEITSDALDTLPYLDAVVREILRLESPVPATIRTAAQDTAVPLGTPVKSRNGGTFSSVVVPKDSTIFISIGAVNKRKATWGEDAHEFRPERWLEGKIEGGVGVYSHMLTFLAGPRACIGYKFALLEIKTILAVLIDDFVFSERNPGLDVERRSAIVTRPLIIGEEELGFRMPIKLSLAPKSS